MTEMAAAVRAQNFRAVHSQAEIIPRDDFFLRRNFRKTRPAAAGIKFVVRLEEYLAAAGAAVNTGFFRVPIFTREGAFGARLAQDVILFGGQELAPFGFGALEGEFHSSLVGGKSFICRGAGWSGLAASRREQTGERDEGQKVFHVFIFYGCDQNNLRGQICRFLPAQPAPRVRPFVNPAYRAIIAILTGRLRTLAIRIHRRRAGKYFLA